MTDDLTTLRVLEAIDRAGWRIDDELRLFDEEGELLAERVAGELELLARFFGLAAVAEA